MSKLERILRFFLYIWIELVSNIKNSKFGSIWASILGTIKLTMTKNCPKNIIFFPLILNSKLVAEKKMLKRVRIENESAKLRRNFWTASERASVKFDSSGEKKNKNELTKKTLIQLPARRSGKRNFREKKISPHFSDIRGQKKHFSYFCPAYNYRGR